MDKHENERTDSFAADALGDKEREQLLNQSPNSDQARQELDGNRWRQVWTNKAYYDGEKETLRMVSSEGKMDTRMINSIGDDFVTEYLVTSTVDGSNDFESGKMKGFLFDYSDEVPTEDGGKTNNGSGGSGSNDDRHGGGGGGGKQTPPPGIRTRL